MKAAQELYEGVEVGDMGAVGLITYMRTDSLRISDEAAQQAAGFIEQRYGKIICRPNAESINPEITPRMPTRQFAQLCRKWLLIK